jgi:hypothetical protein
MSSIKDVARMTDNTDKTISAAVIFFANADFVI